MKFITRSISLLSLTFLLSFSIMAQDNGDDYQPSEQRSDFDLRKKSIMDGNLLRATYHNTGHAGRRGSQSLDELLFEYPRNTGREYMYFISVIMGATVPDQSTTNDPDDTFPITAVSSYRTSRDGRQNWSLNPIIGYVRDDSDEIARSDRGPDSPLGNTWPDVWPDKLEEGGDGWAGSWNGFFGRDQFNADVEFYYRAGDDTYARYANSGRYQPDATDPSRGGLGFILDTRILAWSQTLVNATHFNIFEVVNDASYDYDRVAFGVWIADLIAGSSNGDVPEFDDVRSIAYLTDVERTPAPEIFEGPIGQMGIQFLETPGNSTDGIDNDGDSNFYNPSNAAFYDPDNEDLYFYLRQANGGFYSAAQVDSIVPEFTATDFDQRTITTGDKLVLIDEEGNRIVTTYDGNPFTYQGIDYPGGTLTVQEDLLAESDPNFGVHIDGIDNDFDGIIDENIPNHLEKVTFVNNTEVTIAVQYINYLYFNPGDTLKPGLMVPNSVIRDRVANDTEFAALVNDYYEGRFKNHHTAAPMIDEGRDDQFDNDRDWDLTLDDVGIQGNPDSFSEGQGDGKPSSGAGTPFPGEPNIDKTDVSETDLIGVSRVNIFDAGALNVDQDADVWSSYLVPGEFDREIQVGDDSDIFVSSGLFPLRKGASERFAVAITAAQTKSPTAAGDRNQVNENLFQANQAYQADYQFAVAPTPPRVKAVAGDGKVTLYWDTSSEQSFDRYISRITGNGNDFQGYKIYRATDVAFQDAFTITDASGNAQFYRPLAIIDKADGISGLHPIPINGVQFNLGDDSGLKRFFEDSDVINGRKYYYAVTAYDNGLTSAGIAPSESPIQLSLNPDGSVIFGQNVVEVRPSRSQAGYINPDTPEATIVQGSPGGTVTVDVIDPNALIADALYEVVFEDTLVSGGNNPDTLKTKNFSLLNVTEGASDTLIDRSTGFNGENNPITEGFTVSLNNIEEFRLNTSRSGWVYDESVNPPHGFSFTVTGAPKVSDYEIVIGPNVGFGRSVEKEVPVSSSSTAVLPAIDTNFKIFNTYTNEEIDYAFGDLNRNDYVNARCNPQGNAQPEGYTPPDPGLLSAVPGLVLGKCSDVIFFVENFRGVQDTLTYRVELNPVLTGTTMSSAQPADGDTLKIFTTKPFSSNDVFQFRIDPENLPQVNADSAKQALDDIMVIPNPYIVSNVFEPRTTQNNRQHNRELHFVGMPSPSRLRIFTVSGVLIREIDIQPGDLTGGPNGGTYIWNMLTKDNLEISYGVYLYHVEAKGVGEKIGKFAVIK
ncbi:hypothetical protein AB2B38_002480 [Balneola sp. MJW-20]|uniref:hypothetical protein n=1 Tax=Gracilimonas aurantiaca TaxID=3234185 RepID=UPI0034657962